MKEGLLRIFIYAVLSLAGVLVAFFTVPGQEHWIHEIGKNFALLGFGILVLQFLLASRFKWIERPFGLDIVIRYHKYMAAFGALLLLSHPMLIAAGSGNWNLLTSLRLPWYVLAGKVTLFLFLLNFLLSVYQERLHLKFEKWRLGHDILAPALIALAFTHSWFAGDDLERAPVQALWIVLLILAGSVYAFHRFLRPARLRARPYTVAEVKPEAGDVYTFKLAPPEGREIPPYLPGQFHFITFFRGRNLPVEEHHWTISSSPARRETVTSTIKNLGDFTATIKETRAGDKAAVHGAFGRFSYALHPEEKDLVFISGGIGITPLMSMIRHMRDSRDDRSVTLLYANPKEDQIVFREELEEIEKGETPKLKVVHVLSDPGSEWAGERGFVDREKIERFCGKNLVRKTFYVCGPPPMLRTVIAALRGLGVSDAQIRLEIFSFLD
jgi:predicted ferric reductase